MADIYGVRDGLGRARGLLSVGDDHGRAYAALEIRFCMETIAYRQLDAYGPEIQSQLIKEWNPSRIVRMLALLDEFSDQSAQYSIAVNLPDGIEMPIDGNDQEWAERARELGFIPLGDSNRIPWKKFKTAYNSLGSFVHLSRDGSRIYPTAEKLSEILDMLDKVSESTLIAAMNNVSTAKCGCGSLLVLGPRHQNGSELVYCTNNKCKAVFKADAEQQGAIRQIGQLLLTCPCGGKVPFKRESMLALERCDSCSSSVRAVVLGKLNVVAESY
ncbi:TPA: hypothetical protein UMX25_000942 [Stenotrophomonas maltophilia]|nr:hypothetical protein [Stenotrophomonas maltophilia]HEL4225993.1 hypothetical protein [Stenotrophomonas maltophilia]